MKPYLSREREGGEGREEGEEERRGEENNKKVGPARWLCMCVKAPTNRSVDSNFNPWDAHDERKE